VQLQRVNCIMLQCTNVVRKLTAQFEVESEI
jgi:hypothetical protein